MTKRKKMSRQSKRAGRIKDSDRSKKQPVGCGKSGPRDKRKDSPNAPEKAGHGREPGKIEKVITDRFFLPVVLLLAAVLRVAHVLALRSTLWFNHLNLDCRAYDEWAQRIAGGDWLGTKIFYQDPLYPYFLSILYSLFDRNLLLVRLIQVAFGVGTCWLTALLGRRIFGPVVGNIAGLLAAILTTSVFYEGQIEKTFLSVFLIALFLVLALKRSMYTRFLAGVTLGLAILTRANLLIFVPLGFLVLLFERLPVREGDKQTARSRESGFLNSQSFRHAALFLGGCAIILGPVTLRNHHVAGEWVLTTSQLGQNLYLGNNPRSTTGSYRTPPSVRPDPRYEQEDFHNTAEKRLGRPLKASEVSDYWLGQAWKHIRSEPVFAIRVFFRKFMVFWNDYEVPDNNNIYLLTRYIWILRLPMITFGWIIPLALLGAVVAFRKQREVRILVGFVASYCLSVIAFFVFSRYRVQVVPILVVFAVNGGAWIVDQVREARWKRAAYSGLLLVATGLFCFQNLEGVDRTRSMAISLNNLASLHMRLGNTERAIEVYREAVDTSPEAVVGAMRILGDLYLRQDKFKEAERYMRQVVEIKPSSVKGWTALAWLYERMLSVDIGDPEIYYKLGVAHLSAGQINEAWQVKDEAESQGMPLPDDFVEKLNRAGANKGSR